jgi:predicted protein tyrosine phosphatase
MVTIRICGFHDVKDHAHLPITDIISIGSVEDIPNISAFREKDFALYRFVFEDVSHDCPTGPSLKIVQKMIKTFKTILDNNDSPDVLFHCAAGISRSTAAAFIFLVVAGYSYEKAFGAVYDARGSTYPNQLMIKYADDILNRGGTMLDFVNKSFGHDNEAYRNYQFVE